MVIATGSRARRWPGCGALAGVHVIRTIDDAVALREDLRPGARLVVIGAGFIGAEVASTARKLGLDVTVVEAAPTPLAGSSSGRGSAPSCPLLHADERHAADLRRRRRRPDRRHRASHCRSVTGVDLVDGRHLPADVVVVGIGGVPNIEWLQGSGLELGNGVLCGRRRRRRRSRTLSRSGTARPGTTPAVGAAHRVEHWTGALERPAIAVATLLAGGHRPGHRGQAAVFLVRPVRLAASSSRASRVPTTRSPSRKAAATSAASSPPTDATAAWSRSSASINRACSPGGVVNWRCAPAVVLTATPIHTPRQPQ